jgi:hypothetical protein
MRTIKVKTAGNHVFVTDWNFRQWALTKNTDGTYQCSDMRGVEFGSVDYFITRMYGVAYFLDNKCEKAFVNYEVITELNF